MPQALMAAPGRDAVHGSRTDAYRLVWCAVFALEPGETKTARELLRAIDPKGERGEAFFLTVLRALALAAEVKLCERISLPPPSGRRRHIWARRAWPKVMDFSWLVERGARPTIARNVVHALETGGWLKVEFRTAK